MEENKKSEWYKVVAYASEKKEVKIEGRNVVIEGKPDEMIAVRISDSMLSNLTSSGGNRAIENFLGALSKTIRGSGFKGGVVLVPDSVEFLKLVKISENELSQLEGSSPKENLPLSDKN